MNKGTKYEKLPFDVNGYFSFELCENDSPVFHAWKSVYDQPFVLVCYSELGRSVAVDYMTQDALEFLNTGKWILV